MAIGAQANITVGANTTLGQQSVDKFVNRVRATSANININTTGLNRAAAPLGKITNLATEFEKSMAAANARVIAFGASVSMIASVAGAFKNLISVAVTVEAKLADINSVLQANETQLRSFSSGLFKIAKDTASSFNDVSESALEFARQGKSMEETLKMTSDAMILARLTTLSHTEATQKLTAITNAYKGTIEDTTTVINKLRSVEAAFAVDAGDLANAMQRTASVAAEAGVSFDELNAIVTAVQEKTARGGNVIGNAFKTIFTRVSNADTLEYLEGIGVSVRDMNNELLPAVGILKQVSKLMQNMNSTSRLEVLEKLAGKYNINSLSALMNDFSAGDSGAFEDALKKSQNAGNAAIDANEALNRTVSAMFTKLVESLKLWGVALSELGLIDTLKQALSFLQQLVDSITQLTKESKVFQSIIKGFGSFMEPAIIAGMLVLAKSLGSFLSFLRESTASYLNLNKTAKQRSNLENVIGKELAANAQIQDRILKGTISQRQVEVDILNILKQKVLLSQKVSELSKSGAMAAYGGGFRVDKDGNLTNKGVSFGAAGGGGAMTNLGDIAKATRMGFNPASGDPLNIGTGGHFMLKAGMAGYDKNSPKMDATGANFINQQVAALKDRLSKQVINVDQANRELVRLRDQYGFSSVALGKFRKNIEEYGHVSKLLGQPRSEAVLKSFVAKANAYYDEGLISRDQRDQKIQKKAQFLGNSQGIDYSNLVHVENNKLQLERLRRMQAMYSDIGDGRGAGMFTRMGRGLGNAGRGLMGAMGSGGLVDRWTSGNRGLGMMIGLPMVGGAISRAMTPENADGTMKSRSQMTGMERFKSNAASDIGSYSAMGLMLGGPWGALIGAITGTTSAFLKMEDTLQDVKEREDRESDKRREVIKGMDDYVAALRKMDGKQMTPSMRQKLASEANFDLTGSEALSPAEIAARSRALSRNDERTNAFKWTEVFKLGGDGQMGRELSKDTADGMMRKLFSEMTDDGNAVFDPRKVLGALSGFNEGVNSSRFFLNSDTSDYGLGTGPAQTFDKSGNLLDKKTLMERINALPEGILSQELENAIRSAAEKFSKGSAVDAEGFSNAVNDLMNGAKKQIDKEKAIMEAERAKLNFSTGRDVFLKNFGAASVSNTVQSYNLELKDKYSELYGSIYEPLISALGDNTLQINRDSMTRGRSIQREQLSAQKYAQDSVKSLLDSEAVRSSFADDPAAERALRESLANMDTDAIESSIIDIFERIFASNKSIPTEDKQAIITNAQMIQAEMTQRAQIIEFMKTEEMVRRDADIKMNELNKSFTELNARLGFTASQIATFSSFQQSVSGLQKTRNANSLRNFFGTTEEKGQMAYQYAASENERQLGLETTIARKTFAVEMEKNLATKNNTLALQSLNKTIAEDILSRTSEAYEGKSGEVNDLLSGNNWIDDYATYEKTLQKKMSQRDILGTQVTEARQEFNSFIEGMSSISPILKSITYGMSDAELNSAAKQFIASGGNLSPEQLGQMTVNGSTFGSQLEGMHPTLQESSLTTFNNAIAGVAQKMVEYQAQMEEANQGLHEAQNWIQIQLQQRIFDAKNSMNFTLADPTSTRSQRVQSVIDYNRVNEGRAYGTAQEGRQVFGAEVFDQVQNFQYELAEMTPRLFRDNMVEALTAMANGATSVKDALLGAALAFTQELNKAFAQKLMNGVMMNLGFDGGMKGYSSGGKVTGGSGSKDDVPAALMGGEYVIKKSAVQKYGTSFLDKLNGGQIGQRATGGFWSDLGGYALTGVASSYISSQMATKPKTDKEYKEQRAWAKEAAKRYGTQQGPDYFAVGTTMPNGNMAGVMSGAGSMLNFAKQNATSGSLDQFYRIGTGYAASLEDESAKLGIRARLGLIDGTRIAGEVEQAKEQAFSTYASYKQQIQSQKEAYEAEKKAQKRQLIGNLIGGVTMGLLSGAFSQTPRAIPIDESTGQPMADIWKPKSGLSSLTGGLSNLWGGVKNLFGFGANSAASAATAGSGMTETERLINATPQVGTGSYPQYSPNTPYEKSGTSALAEIGKAALNGFKATAYGNANIDADTAAEISRGAIKPEWQFLGNKGNKLIPGFSVASNYFGHGTMLDVYKGDQYIGNYRVDDIGGMAKNVVDFYAGDNKELYDYYARLGGNLRVVRRAMGGMIYGGSGVKDDVNALLMGGEYVMNKNSVQTYGKGFFDSVNKGTFKMASGGMVGSDFVKQPSDNIATTAPSRGNVTFNLTFNVEKSGQTSESSDSPENSTEKEREMMNKVKNVVYEVIQEESRLGGLLAS